MRDTPPATPTTSHAPQTLIGAGGDPGVEQRRAGETYRHFQERRDEACVGWGQKPASLPPLAKETPIHAGDDASGFPPGNMEEWGTKFDKEQGGGIQQQQQHYAHYPPPPTGAQSWELQAGAKPYVGKFDQEQGGGMQQQQQHYVQYPPPPTGAQSWELQAGAM